MTDVSNTDDVIDSRNVIARIEELTDERQSLLDTIAKEEENRSELQDGDTLQNYDAAKEAIDDARTSLAWWDGDNGAELEALKALAEEAEGYSEDWVHGATLIRESYFTEYAQELCEDIGDLPKDLPHYIVIDWEATADNLKADYTEVDFDGVAYLVR